MIRRMSMLLGLCLILSMSGREARAQWGYGYGGWGWGGWGAATPQSAALQGAGYYAMGAGMYNLNTAQARSINAQTAMQWNDYVAQVTHESARIHEMRVHSEFQKNQRLYDDWKNRLRNSPGRVEIEDGSALNVALDDLTNPRLGSSALRAASAPVPASLIAEVPFVNNAERVTLMLDHMRQGVKWPAALEGERFSDAKKMFDEIRADPQGSRRERRGLAQDPANRRGARQLPPGQGDRPAALRPARPAGGPEVPHDLPEPPEPAEEAGYPARDDRAEEGPGHDDRQPPGLHALFQPPVRRANTLKEKQAYSRLFEVLDQTRDQILAEAKLDSTATAQANPKPAVDYNQQLNQVRRPGAAPQPPAPRNPQ